MTHHLLSPLRNEIGQTFLSEWMMVDQSLVNAFAETTDDPQFIHVDPELAGATPFGGTIAHGFLLLSLLPALRNGTARPLVAAVGTRINYGFDRIRFVSPVRTGKRIRASFTTVEVVEKHPGQFQQTTDVTIEIEGQTQPAVAARWITQIRT